jgi:hypothetical protein
VNQPSEPDQFLCFEKFVCLVGLRWKQMLLGVFVIYIFVDLGFYFWDMHNVFEDEKIVVVCIIGSLSTIVVASVSI